MKAGAGKNKGNRFENKIARALSLWITDYEDSTQLIPSRLSGGWGDGSWRHAGDLAPNGTHGDMFRSIFVVECKHRKSNVLWSMYNTIGNNIQGWWVKLCGEAEEHQQLPMLVCRQNNRPVLVGLPAELVRKAVKEGLFTGPLLIHVAPGIHDCGLLLLHSLLTWDYDEFTELIPMERTNDAP